MLGGMPKSTQRWFLTATFLVAAFGGFLVGDTATAVSNAASTGGTQMRTGTVTTWDTSVITVRVARTPLPAMPYPRSYQPILGDIVTVFGAGSTWFCLGAAAGSPPDNAVTNPSFESGSIGSLPTGWGNYHLPGSATSIVDTEPWPGGAPLNGVQVLSVAASGSGARFSDDFSYSSPFKVNPGETWAVAAYAQAQTFSANDAVSVGVFLTYYANNTDVYPTTSAANSGGGGAELGVSADWSLIGSTSPQGIVIPNNAVYARLTLETQITANSPLAGLGPIVSWDGALARKVT